MTLKAHQWKPGQSGNPGGRRQKPATAKMLEQMLTENDSEKARKLAERLLSLAINQGSIQAAKLILEFTDIKPAKIAGEKNEPTLTPEQVDQQLAELLKDPSLRERLVKLLTPDAKVIQ